MLYQASNISPSTIGSIGNGIVDINAGLSVSWQLNGSSPITGYKIDLYLNDANSTFVWSSGEQNIDPVYPVDAKGRPQYIKLHFDKNSDVSLPVGTLINGVSYKFLITQFWGTGETRKSITQNIANVFYSRATPSLSLYQKDGSNIPLEFNQRTINIKGQYLQEQNVPIRDVTWRLSLVEDNNLRIIDEYTVNNTQVLEYTYETLISGNAYIITAIVNNVDDMQVVAESEFNVEYAESKPVENLQVSRAIGKNANILTWQGFTRIVGSGNGDYVFVENEPNFGDKCVAIGFNEDVFTGNGVLKTFRLTKTYDFNSEYDIVKINDIRIFNYEIDSNNNLVFNTAPTALSKISILYKTTTIGSSVVFDEINGKEMRDANLSINNNIIWQGTIESENVTLLDIVGEYNNDLGQNIGEYSFKIVNESNILKVLVNGREIVTTQSRINVHQKYEYMYDWWTVIFSSTNNTIENGKSVVYINRYEMVYPLYANEYIYPSNYRFARAKVINTIRNKSTFVVNNKVGRINSIKLGDNQWCDYLRIDNIPLSNDSINTIIPIKNSNSPFDLYNSKRVIGNYLLANFDEDFSAGDNAGTIFSGSVVVREEFDSNKQDILTTVSSDELGVLYDYGIKSGKSYRYLVYGQGETALSATVSTPYICNQFQAHSLIVARKRSDEADLEIITDSNLDYQYIVEKEYLFKHNVSFGEMSNNTKVSYLSNFTRYPVKQVSPSNYKSGNISGLIGAIDFIETDDTTEEVYKYISKDFAKNFVFGGSVYTVGTVYDYNWLSQEVGGEPITPRENTYYLVQSDGLYKNKAYYWNKTFYEECGEQKLTTVGGKRYSYLYRDSLESADEIFNLATLPNKHFFIKDMKGNFLKVDISQPMSMQINYKNEAMPITMQISWTEIDSTDKIVLYANERG